MALSVTLLGACGGADPSEVATHGTEAPLTLTATFWPGTLASQWRFTGGQGAVRFAVDNPNLDLRSALWPASVDNVLLLPWGAGPHSLTAQTLTLEQGWSAATTAQLSGTAVRLDAGAGVGTSCFVVAGARVYCLGVNDRGQLGVGDVVSRGGDAAGLGGAAVAVGLPAGAVTALAVGAAHACALAADGGVRCWGDNLFGQLGATGVAQIGARPADLGAALARVALPDVAAAIAAGGALSAALLKSGSVVVWGQAAASAEPIAVALPGRGAAVALAAGDAHLCVMMAGGTVACMGANGLGQLGTGDQTARPAAAAAAAAVDLGTGRRALLLRAGGAQTCAVLDDLTLKCWGRTAGGGAEVRTGDALPALPVGAGRYPLDVAVGGGHVCVLRDDQSIVCLGRNDQGQLGQGTDVDAVYPTAAAAAPVVVDLGAGTPLPRGIIAGAGHSCALLADGSRRCWGGNQFGQLGLGDLRGRGRAAADLGQALPPVMLP